MKKYYENQADVPKMLVRTAKSRIVKQVAAGLGMEVFEVPMVEDPDEFNRQQDARMNEMLENLLAESEYRHENREHF